MLMSCLSNTNNNNSGKVKRKGANPICLKHCTQERLMTLDKINLGHIIKTEWCDQDK